MYYKRKVVKHPDGELVTKTRKLLSETPYTYSEIQKHTQLQPSWLSQFARDPNCDPGVNRVEALYTFLSGSPLSLG